MGNTYKCFILTLRLLRATIVVPIRQSATATRDYSRFPYSFVYTVTMEWAESIFMRLRQFRLVWILIG